MTETLDLPPIADVLPPQQEAPALPTDLKRVDLQAVALAQFGDWRTDVAAARKNLGTLALDLSIPARIAEAKSLRERVINAPRAQVRKVSKALKSKLAAVSKTIGAEEEAAVLAYDEAETLITPQIEAAEQRIEDERLKKAKEEADRLASLREKVDAIMAAWIGRSQAEGMTSDRLAVGIEAFKALKVPPELADVDVHWFTAHASTLSALDHAYLALRRAELEAAQAKAREEQARVAGIQQRIAEIQAAATGHERATAADLDEARAIVRALRIDADTYAEFLPLAQAAQQATLATLEGLHAAAVQREAEAAAERARLAAALPPAPPPKCELSDPGVTVPDAQEGVADNPLQLEPVADVTAGDLAADGAGDEGAGPPHDSPAAGRVILVEPDANAIWSAALRGDGTQQLPAGVPLIRGEIGTIDAGITIVGNPPFSNDDGSLETSEADARPWTPSPFYDTPAAPAIDPRDEFVALVMTAFDCKFPSHPKPSQEWWAKVRAAGQALQA